MLEVPTADDMRRELHRIEDLATLPHVMERLHELAADPKTGARDVGEAIAQDQSLTAKILKVANSAFYARAGGVADIVEATVLLGFEEITRLILTVSVIGAFERGRRRSDERVRFWLHCFHTAALAELIDRDKGRGGGGAFTAGLLHDLGRIVLDQYFPEVYAKISVLEAEADEPPATVEKQLLGYTHAHIGFWLTEAWRFPQALCEAIRFHHEPQNSLGAGRLTAFVHVADALAHRTDDYKDAVPREINPAALALLKMEAADLERYQNQLVELIAGGDTVVQDLIAFLD